MKRPNQSRDAVTVSARCSELTNRRTHIDLHIDRAMLSQFRRVCVRRLVNEGYVDANLLQNLNFLCEYGQAADPDAWVTNLRVFTHEYRSEHKY